MQNPASGSNDMPDARRSEPQPRSGEDATGKHGPVWGSMLDVRLDEDEGELAEAALEHPARVEPARRGSQPGRRRPSKRRR